MWHDTKFIASVDVEKSCEWSLGHLGSDVYVCVCVCVSVCVVYGEHV